MDVPDQRHINIYKKLNNVKKKKLLHFFKNKNRKI